MEMLQSVLSMSAFALVLFCLAQILLLRRAMSAAGEKADGRAEELRRLVEGARPVWLQWVDNAVDCAEQIREAARKADKAGPKWDRADLLRAAAEYLLHRARAEKVPEPSRAAAELAIEAELGRRARMG